MFFYIRYLLLSVNHKGKSSDDLGCFNQINDPKDICRLYFEVNSQIEIDANADEFEKALQIARFLRMKIPVGPALSLSSQKTLEAVMQGKGAVCSDFSLIFNIFCLINNIKVKEWNCVDRFYKSNYGHNFNEIYSSRLKKWIAVDAHMGVYFVGDDKKLPLSVVELFKYRRKGNDLHFVNFSDYIHQNVERMKMIYSGFTIPFLIVNFKNDDNDYFLNKFQGIPSFAINAMLILKRKNYQFLFVLDNYKVKLLPKYFQDLASD